MRKYELILLTLVPIFAGYLINLILFVPVIGMILFYILPLLVLVFWFWLGGQYSKTDWKVVPSLLISSTTGILSLALYLWQFFGQNDETRSLTLAGLSQMYSAATPSYLIVRLAMLFESQPNYFGRTAALAEQVLSLILMITVFTAGYLCGKKHRIRKKKCDMSPKQG
ncbi:MAG: hypothetical protein ACI4S2_08600 [Lachnospiraceae bacterium]